MGNESLREEIYKAVNNNPALEIVKEANYSSRRIDNYSTRRGTSEASDKFQQILESKEDYGETLQMHLLHQYRMLLMLLKLISGMGNRLPIRNVVGAVMKIGI
jgi:DNA-directed RNA polymerase specialized sigma54-like protein